MANPFLAITIPGKLAKNAKLYTDAGGRLNGINNFDIIKASNATISDSTRRVLINKHRDKIAETMHGDALKFLDAKDALFGKTKTRIQAGRRKRLDEELLSIELDELADAAKLTDRSTTVGEKKTLPDMGNIDALKFFNVAPEEGLATKTALLKKKVALAKKRLTPRQARIAKEKRDRKIQQIKDANDAFERGEGVVDPFTMKRNREEIEARAITIDSRGRIINKPPKASANDDRSALVLDIKQRLLQKKEDNE